jgi:hypothetical protein
MEDHMPPKGKRTDLAALVASQASQPAPAAVDSSLSQAEPAPTAATLAAEPPVQVAKPAGRRGKNPALRHHTLYLPKAVHDQVWRLALEEDTKPHALFKEGLNLLFKSRGLRSWEDLAG